MISWWQLGGFWANKEMQTLVPFLTEKVKAGSLTLGGLDDQLGAGTWASKRCPPIWFSLLSQERARCASILRRHMLWQYTDEAPYSPADKEKIVGCLTEIQAQLASATQKTKSVDQERAVMLDSLQRAFARDFTEDDFTKKDQTL